MTAVLVDSNVLLDVLTREAPWFTWSAAALERTAIRYPLVINPIIYGEVSAWFLRIEELDEALPESAFTREPLPYEAAFLAGKAFLKYRRRGGTKSALFPDFLIGAHAAVQNYRILTRDRDHYRSYFPQVPLIAPE